MDESERTLTLLLSPQLAALLGAAARHAKTSRETVAMDALVEGLTVSEARQRAVKSTPEYRMLAVDKLDPKRFDDLGPFYASQIRRFLASKRRLRDKRNISGLFKVALECRFSHFLMSAIRDVAARTRDNPYRKVWTTVDDIRNWLERRPKFIRDVERGKVIDWPVWD